MNKKMLFLLICYTFIGISCNIKNGSHNSISSDELNSPESVLDSRDETYYISKGYQVFSKYGFAIKAPCQLKDVSKQASGDFVLNYGGVENENVPSKFAAYQLVINQLPVAYKYMSSSDKTKVKKRLLSMAQKMESYQAVKVGHEGYDGYIMKTTHNGYSLKGEIFIKDDLIIGLTVISNDQLESKFNKYTNSLKFLSTAKNTSVTKLLEAAEAKGFQRGKIQHCLGTNWTEFGDRKYYSYVKTLETGIKVYRAELEDMILENHIQDNIIKKQSSTFILNDQTTQTMKEMDAWILSCNPTTASGDIIKTRKYSFKDWSIILKNEGTSIHYSISCKSDISDQSVSSKQALAKLYSNEYFSIKYPISWQIVQDDKKVTNSISISVQIMEKSDDNFTFRPNINIIVSERKCTESAAMLANVTISQTKQAVPNYQLLKKEDNIKLSNCQGSKIEQQITMQGYKLRIIQYIVKKKDNTTYTITAALDANKYSTQLAVMNKIINTLTIK